jgi:hypothetical protein
VALFDLNSKLSHRDPLSRPTLIVSRYSKINRSTGFTFLKTKFNLAGAGWGESAFAARYYYFPNNSMKYQLFCVI